MRRENPDETIIDRIGKFVGSRSYLFVWIVAFLIGITCKLLSLLASFFPDIQVLSWLSFIGTIIMVLPFGGYVLFFLLALLMYPIHLYRELCQSTGKRIIPLAVSAISLVLILLAFLFFTDSFPADSIPDSPSSASIFIESESEEVTEMIFIASSQGEKFHKPGCRYVDNISSGNKVYYETREDAIADGKTACSVCDP